MVSTPVTVSMQAPCQRTSAVKKSRARSGSCPLKTSATNSRATSIRWSSSASASCAPASFVRMRPCRRAIALRNPGTPSPASPLRVQPLRRNGSSQLRSRCGHGAAGTAAARPAARARGARPPPGGRARRHGGALVLSRRAGRRARPRCSSTRSRRRRSSGSLAPPGSKGRWSSPFAALQQLCAPILDLGSACPIRSATRFASRSGSAPGRAPNPFLVGLAVLGLLSEAAEERPLLCVVDDAQWLDRASARALAFVARRLLAERIALVFAARERGEALGGLPELTSDLWDIMTRGRCWSPCLPAPLDERVLERIVVETRGNPLALLELPRGLTPTQLAGGFGLPAAVPLSARIEETSRVGWRALPPDARRLLLLAAADPTGDLALVWRAAERLGIPESAARALRVGRLAGLRAGVVFRHPLVRSAVYRAAEPEERSEVHRALAEATDPEIDPDRRAWHLAQAASMPDEDVAAELERSAARAQARGGFAAAAAFLERSSVLTPDAAPSGRARARRGPGEAAGGCARRGAHARCERGGRPAGRASSGRRLDRPARPDLVRRRNVGARRRRCCSRPPGDSSRSTLGWPARPTSMPCPPPCSPAASPARAVLGEVAAAARAAPEPPTPPARGGSAARRVGAADHRRPGDGTPAVREALRAFAQRRHRSGRRLRWRWLAGRAAGFIWDYEAGTR